MGETMDDGMKEIERMAKEVYPDNPEAVAYWLSIERRQRYYDKRGVSMRIVYECEGCVLDEKCILVGEVKPDMCVLSGTPCKWRFLNDREEED